jgi:hypothetical protein
MMKHSAPSQTMTSHCDVTSLLSHLGLFSPNTKYRELVSQEAARIAACRWPLLGEIQGIGDENSNTAG